ncbi:LPXTG cell wall anchor domain-containing protein [Pediococcus claussenii]|uniref:LPXTG-motif cell wall anchor domain protein n=1 Tax=Pediococcus claussenii (strain ATCC BAA-344 / DSM 14800 / JCM 18046 / KCTC 3811 / LMG 21948 / P06) TaxID=701521 RepID=G8PCE2_PEDCP|nr:LPXTG cell wall anchor domain-containing protein [Pediococcus claussenii]AEV94927.1 LPXTG-motif cell wall anchor domain protein [Pediococcus claussenii ATCC BAA-344]KRN19269.1 hypothetical protein IV79_GL001642 [Pediococcus claussenii]
MTTPSDTLDSVTSPDLSQKGYGTPDQAVVGAEKIPESYNGVKNINVVIKYVQLVVPSKPVAPNKPGISNKPIVPGTPNNPSIPNKLKTPNKPGTPIRPNVPVATVLPNGPRKSVTISKLGTPSFDQKISRNVIKLSRSTADKGKRLPQTNEDNSSERVLVIIGTLLSVLTLGLIGTKKKNSNL